MVAIVSGNSLGLNLTSKGVLGDQGVLGDPSAGQGNEAVYVNASTGNLVVQQLQDELVGPGLDVDTVLTYNSLGQANDDNGDNFSLGQVPAQLALTGTVKTVGSSVTVTNFDGSKASYGWDAVNSRYVTTAGGGVYGVITYDGTKYTLFDGTTQQTSVYDGATGRLLTRSDTSGNSLTYGYDATSGKLTKVTDAAGEVVTYTYAGTLLQSISAPVLAKGTGGAYATTTQPVVTYGYDTSNRLATVTVDLSPDGSIADGNTYVTSFTYDGTSKRIASMQQSDGTKLSFVYDASQRIYKITDGLNNVTTYTYDTANRKTSVLANGQTTVYAYDANGQLLSVTSPAVNGTSAVLQYAYNANGDVVSTTDADGRKTLMAYDGAGEVLSKTDAAGDITMYAYDGKQRLITQTTSLMTVPSIQATPVSTGGLAIAGGNIQKTGTTTGWDAGVQTPPTASVSFTAGPTTGDLAVGLSQAVGNAGVVSYSSLDYAFRLTAGALYVWMRGTLVYTGTYNAGDNLNISSAYQGNFIANITFSQNGKLLYTANNQPSTGGLEAYAGFYSPGTQVTNLRTGFPNNAIPDPDMTTRYVYSADGRDLLRFKIDPSGHVTEYGYDAKGNLTSTNEYTNATYGTSLTPYDPKTTYDTSGLSPANVPTEATMVTWRNAQDLTQTDRTDYARDVRGQLSTTTSYSKTATDGTGIFNASTSTKTTYVYDAAGNLLNHTLGTVSASTAVDGLGRTISSTDGLARTTLTAYAGGTIKTTAPNGLVTTQTFDADGRLVHVTNVSAGVNQQSTTDVYDASGNLLQSVDATNVSTWALYDAAGRRVASIDGNGIMTEYVLDTAGLVTQTITYATPVNTALLVNAGGSPINPPLASVRPTANAAADRRVSTSYDAVGRASAIVDSAGLTTSIGYDGAGRESFQHSYDSSTGATRGSLVKQYDADGNLVLTFDQASIAGLYGYDDIGNQISSDVANQDYTVTLYDRSGRVVGQLQGAGGAGDAYVTETVYNASGLVDHVTRYATTWSNFAQYINNGFNGVTIDTVRPAASPADETTSYVYDANGRLTSRTDPAGIVTSYAYETGSNRIASITTGASRPDATTVQKRYDAWGRVTAELSGVGSSTLGASPTPAQVTAAWAAYSTQYTYDAAGRLATQKDALGNTTTYFYDNNGQLRYTVDPQGRVTESRYDSFGDTTFVIHYATAISMTGITAGGLVPAALTSAVSAVAQPAKDQITRNVYDTMGHLTLSVSPAGTATTYVNNQFGDVVQSRRYNQSVAATAALSDTDAQLTALVTASADAVHDQITSMRYNADGYLTALAGPTGAVTVYQRDVDGRATSVTQLATLLTSAQLLDYRDLSTEITTSSSDLTTVNVYDEKGQLALSFDPAGFGTEYTRDASGNVVSELRFAKSWSSVFGTSPINAWFNEIASLNYSLSDPVNDRVTRNVYDKDNQLVLAIDATGAATSYAYDANGNVRQQIRYANAVPASAAKLTGDTDAQLLALVATQADAAHDQLTRRVYDADSRLVLAVDPAGSATSYVYDVNDNVRQELRSANVVAASAAKLTGDTDAQLLALVAAQADATRDQLIRKVYDADNELTLLVDPTGLATGYTYDANGTLTQMRVYGNKVATSTTATDAQLVAQLVADATKDRTTLDEYDADARQVYSVDELSHATRTVYDAMGNVAYTISADGSLTQNQYDTAGELVKSTTFSTLLSSTTMAGLAHALTLAQAAALVPASTPSDAVTQNRYDNFGRLRFTMDGAGGLTELRYDVDGNVVDRFGYANKATWNAGADPTVVADPLHDRHVHSSYDAFGDVVAQADGTGSVVVNTYDADGRLTDRLASPTRRASWQAAGPPASCRASPRTPRATSTNASSMTRSAVSRIRPTARAPSRRMPTTPPATWRRAACSPRRRARPRPSTRWPPADRIARIASATTRSTGRSGTPMRRAPSASPATTPTATSPCASSTRSRSPAPCRPARRRWRPARPIGSRATRTTRSASSPTPSIRSTASRSTRISWTAACSRRPPTRPPSPQARPRPPSRSTPRSTRPRGTSTTARAMCANARTPWAACSPTRTTAWATRSRSPTRSPSSGTTATTRTAAS